MFSLGVLRLTQAGLPRVLDATIAPPHLLLGTSKGGTGRLRQVPPIRSIEDNAGAGPKAKITDRVGAQVSIA